MTKSRLETALDTVAKTRGLQDFAHLCKEYPTSGEILKNEISQVISALDTISWRPISEAPQNRTPILAKTRPDIFPEDNIRSGWNNRLIVIRREMPLSDDPAEKTGWSIAAPVGYGGIPDDWLLGWQEISF